VRRSGSARGFLGAGGALVAILVAVSAAAGCSSGTPSTTATPATATPATRTPATSTPPAGTAAPRSPVPGPAGPSTSNSPGGESASAATALPGTSSDPVPSISGVPTVDSTTGGVAVSRHSLVHDGRTREWVQYTPPQGSAGRPLVVFLAGTDATVKFETARDRLLPLVAAGDFTAVYPVAFDESWNAGDGCCNEAAAAHLDDVGFVRDVTARALALDDPDRSRVYLAGYSGGGKIGWNLVCTDPGVFAALATFGANPENGCSTDGAPLSVLIGFGAKDRAEPLAGEKTDKRGTHPPAAENLDAWLARDRCPAASTTRTTTDVTLKSWDCAGSTTVVYAIWPNERHIWPQPPSTTLTGSAGLVMWAFLASQSR
jgi:polyhydroxybutyrate depolymerase